MPLNSNQIQGLAHLLDEAALASREVERLTISYPDLTLSDAYRIQATGIGLRLARGERQTGLKMGLTSEAKRKQMDLKSPVYGVLTDRMQVEEGSTFSLQGKIHPKIEPEIAFLIKNEIQGVPTPAEALAACSGVMAAMEILDSRYLNFKYFSLPDVVADNSSSAYFVLGRTLLDPRIHSGSPEEIDWAKLEMVMEVNGKPVERAISNAISGNPVNSIVQLCELLSENGLTLPAGSIVLAGAATQAVQLESGMEICLRVEKLGTVNLRIG